MTLRSNHADQAIDHLNLDVDADISARLYGQCMFEPAVFSFLLHM